VALIRGVRTPAFFPLRGAALAVIYTDVFRGNPTILLVFPGRFRPCPR
jgi:polar amino acid transport system permease protein